MVNLDSTVLLMDFIVNVGNKGDTWRSMTGRNDFPYLNLRDEMLLEFCENQDLPITVCSNRNLFISAFGTSRARAQGAWFVIVSSLYLQRSCVLDIGVKKGVITTTDHHLVVSWICHTGFWSTLSKPSRALCIAWGCLAEASVTDEFNSLHQKEFSLILSEVRDSESECTMFNSSIIEVAERHCGWKEVLMDTRVQGSHQDEEEWIPTNVDRGLSWFCWEV